MNQDSFISKFGSIVASTILGASLIISAIFVSRSLDNVALKISQHPVPSFNTGPVLFSNPLHVQLDNTGVASPLKVETHEAK